MPSSFDTSMRMRGVGANEGPTLADGRGCRHGGCHLRVTLYHNEDAVEGTSVHDHTETITRHGHTVADVVGTSDDATRILEAESDLVVASGGDGTVSTAARVLAGTRTPLAI